MEVGQAKMTQVHWVNRHLGDIGPKEVLMARGKVKSPLWPSDFSMRPVKSAWGIGHMVSK